MATCACSAVHGLLANLAGMSAMGAYHCPMDVLNLLISCKPVARTLVKLPVWLPAITRCSILDVVFRKFAASMPLRVQTWSVITCLFGRVRAYCHVSVHNVRYLRSFLPSDFITVRLD